MKVIVDVQYVDNTAYVALGLFEEWSSDTFAKVILKKIENVAPYESGAFYKREMPCIIAALNEAAITDNIDTLVIDGFVHLSKTRIGLGMHLYNALTRTPITDSKFASIKIIGIAKTKFKGCEEVSKPLIRGSLASNPLYITAVGISLDEAVTIVKNMHDKARIPTLANAIDRHARDFAKRGI